MSKHITVDRPLYGIAPVAHVVPPHLDNVVAPRQAVMLAALDLLAQPTLVLFAHAGEEFFNRA